MLTLAAIDAGSNAIRVLIAAAEGPDRIERIEAERLPVRLGHGAFTQGELDAETIQQAIAAFRRFRKLFDDHGVDRYRAVATAATRAARNRELLQHRLYHETGIELEVIDGGEEARLVRKAVLGALGRRAAPGLMMDLGGGSLEIGLRSGARWRSATLPIGTVRLVETFGLDGAIDEDAARMVRRHVRTLLAPYRAAAKAAAAGGPAVAIGGNAEALADLVGDRSEDRIPVLPVAALRQALPEILRLDVPGRVTRFGVRRDRAEVMGVAALVLATAARHLDLPALLVPGVGLREGILRELAETAGEAVPPGTAAAARRGRVLAGAWNFAVNVGHDLSHGEQVRRLAKSLFAQLRAVHGLPDDRCLVLEMAALLHDVGEVVHRKGHHRHGEYLVRHGRLPGLEPVEREMVAALVRAHRRSVPDPQRHESYAALPPERRLEVDRLLPLLRLADGLDTEHRGQVRGVRAHVAPDRVTLELEVPPGEAPLLYTPLRKAEVFERVFGRSVTCTVVPPAESAPPSPTTGI